MLKNFARLGAVAAFLMGTAAHAQLATFDDYTGGCTTSTLNVLITTAYKGFTWDNFYVGNGVTTTTNSGGPGYTSGVVSPSCMSFNGFGLNSSLSSTSDFTFNGGYFTSAFNNGNVVTITALNSANVQVFSTALTLLTSGPQLLNVNWAGVRTVNFASSNSQFVFDNFRFNNTVDPTIPTTTAPEPATFALMGVGLAAVMFAGRRRRR